MIAPFKIVNSIDRANIRCREENLLAKLDTYTMNDREFVFITYFDRDSLMAVAAELVSKEIDGAVLYGSYVMCSDGRWKDGSGLCEDSLIMLLPQEMFTGIHVGSQIVEGATHD